MLITLGQLKFINLHFCSFHLLFSIRQSHIILKISSLSITLPLDHVYGYTTYRGQSLSDLARSL